MMNKIPAILIALAAVLQVQAAPPSDTCKQETWVTNGPVNAIVSVGNKVYIGGQFNRVGPYIGGGVPIDTSTGAPVAAFPKINGAVSAVCADGSGGWFVGGLFSSIDGVARNNIAHILPSGSLDPVWNPNANNDVNSLLASGTTVYAGGAFDTINGQNRNYIAALDAATGNVLTTWNPSANDVVYSLTVSGTTVFAGGNFTGIGDSTRYRIAALDATSGKATAWNPVANDIVYSLAVSGSTVYVGGGFTDIGDSSRNYIAALNAATGKATAWNPNANNIVYSFAVSGTTIYTGGSFTGIGGTVRNHIAALNATTGSALAWNPNANGVVLSLAVSGSTVYAGGGFITIGDSTRYCIAALDATTGKAMAWNPNADNQVKSLAVSGATVYAGGYFTSIGWQSRNNIAALDATTGKATAWNPNANNRIQSLAVSGSTVYAGGLFTSIGDSSRNNIAALDATTGKTTAWNPNANGTVYSLAASGATVYAAGEFTSIGGIGRNRIAALDTAGNTLAWNPNANSVVYSLAVGGAMVYAGGNFTTIGDSSRKYIAALNATTGKATAWNPIANGGVVSIAVSGSTIYVGGDFTGIGGQNRNRIAALDATTGKATAWNPNVGGGGSAVLSLAVSGTTVYTGGNFTTIGGQSRSNITALDTATGSSLAWNPNADNFGIVRSLAVSGATVYVGGDFNRIGQGFSHPYFSQFGNYYLAPVVQSISPSSGMNNTSVQITNLSGSNFRSGATVKLVKTGQTDINATGVSAVSSSQISCTIDITNAAPGAWDVVVFNEDTKSDTLVQGFTVTSLPPVLVSPANNAVNMSLTPTLTWHKAANDSLYTMQVSANSGFSSFLINNNFVQDTFFSVPSNVLSNNTPYFWKVCITKKGGEVTAFSAPWTFTTIVAAPSTPSLASPSNSATNQPLITSLTWTSVPGASTYHVQMSTSAAFTDTIVDDSTLTSPTKAIGPLSTSKTYYWRVNAKNAGGTSAWSSVWSFSTIPPAPAVPTLSSPANSATDQSLNLPLTWLAVSGAATYHVQMSTSATFADTVADDSTLTSPTKSVGPLSTSKTYYWRVNAKNPGGTSAWSGIWSFGTIPPVAGAPVPLSPANSAQNQQLNLTLTWNAVTGAATYRTQVATDTGFTSIVNDDSTLTAPAKAVGPLITGTTYYWRINAKNPGGTSAWSEKWSFTTIPPAPGTPILVSPADIDNNASITPLLIWNRAVGTATYRLQIGADSLFNTIIMQDSTLTDTSKSCAALINDATYFWRVNATNPGGTGAWSSVRRFTTIVALPSVVALKTLATGDTIKTDSVFLSWSTGTPKVDRYSVEYATDSSFTSPTIDSTVSDTVKLIRNLQNNMTVWWKVKAHNAAGWGDWSSKNAFAVKLITTHARPATVPKTFSFNIFGHTGAIRYALPKAEHVSMHIYSINGQLQSEPVNMQQAAGYYTVNMQRSAYAAGSYLVVFRAGDYYQKKMIFLTK